VALGLTEAHQIWEEYTYPILNWAHQQNGIAGFVHMQYLDGGIPQSLSCCIPIEYPITVRILPTGFRKELAGLLGVIRERLYIGITVPEMIGKGTGRDGSQTEGISFTVEEPSIALIMQHLAV
jgi:hypothetical protein